MTEHPQVQAPGAAFNFAQHLIERNIRPPSQNRLHRRSKAV